MFHERARSFQAVFLVLDATCIALAFAAAFALRFAHDAIPLLRRIPSTPWLSAPPSDYAVLLITSIVIWLLYLRRSRLYLDGQALRMKRVAPVYLKGFVLSILGTGAVVFALKIGSVSRLFFAYFFGSGIVLLLVKQLLAAWIIHRGRGPRRRHALVIGSERPASWFASIVRDAGHGDYELVGVLVSGNERLGGGDTPGPGGIEELDRILAEREVEEVFLVGSAREMTELGPVAQRLIERGTMVSLVSTLGSGGHGVIGRVTRFGGVPMLSYGPMPRDEVRSGLKRLMDVTLSGLALVVLSPLLLATALAILLFDRGPVLFRQQRLGVGGRRFTLYKFRSMRADAEEVLRADSALYDRYVRNDYKLPEKEDPRISRLGSFLRHSSLDELPQLWNVLRGDMTLVGPRPIVPSEIEKYEPYADLFLSVRPGLTGHWQVSGRSRIPYPERAFLDLDYVGSHSLAADLSIMLRTVPAVLKKKGAY